MLEMHKNWKGILVLKLFRRGYDNVDIILIVMQEILLHLLSPHSEFSLLGNNFKKF